MKSTRFLLFPFCPISVKIVGASFSVSHFYLLIYFLILIVGESSFSQSMDITLNDSSNKENPSYEEKTDKGGRIIVP